MAPAFASSDVKKLSTAEKRPPAPPEAKAKDRRLRRLALTVAPATSPDYGKPFVARYRADVEDACRAYWLERCPQVSATAWGVAQILAGEYHRDGAERGWTPTRFFSMLAYALAKSTKAKGSRTREKYAALIFDAGLFLPQRRHGSARGEILRIFIEPRYLEDEGQKICSRGETRRAMDARRKRALRAKIGTERPQNFADTPHLPVAIVRTALEEFEAELAQNGDSGQIENVSAQTARDPEPVHTTAMGHTHAPNPNPPPITSPKSCIKQIPHTPTPAARGLADSSNEKSKAGEGGSEGGRPGFPSAEALEDHLYRFICSKPASEAPKLREQVGDTVFDALKKAHPYGIQGLKTCQAQEVRRVCQGVAKRCTPKPTTERQRAARYRQKVDRRGGAATEAQIRDAAEAILGSVAAAALNPRHLAYQGLTLAAAEAVLGRGQRCLKVGTQGPRALRTPGALNAYFIKAFRQDNLVHGRAPGRGVL